MIRKFLQLFGVLLISACSDSNQDNTTEIITDSYFFQKNIFNVNLYECVDAQESFLASYKTSINQSVFINFSEINGKGNVVSGCNLFFTTVNELTPTKEDLLAEDMYLEVSECKAKVDETAVYTALSTYLDYIKTNNLQVWSSISIFEENQFHWINVWPSKTYREDFLRTWIDLPVSGRFAKELTDVAVCSAPSTYLFLN